MSKQVIVFFVAFFFVAFAGALVACSSGDGSPAGLPFDPLGSEAAPAGTDATGGGTEPPPPSPETSLERLCTTVCVRFQAACSTDNACDASSCANIAAYAGNCQEELRTYLACLARAPIECGQYGPDITACQGLADVFSRCSSGGYY